MYPAVEQVAVGVVLPQRLRPIAGHAQVGVHTLDLVGAAVRIYQVVGRHTAESQVDAEGCVVNRYGCHGWRCLSPGGRRPRQRDTALCAVTVQRAGYISAGVGGDVNTLGRHNIDLSLEREGIRIAVEYDSGNKWSIRKQKSQAISLALSVGLYGNDGIPAQKSPGGASPHPVSALMAKWLAS
mgnify:CR=1 FL=1